MNFESSKQQNAFLYFLKELGYVLFFTVVLCAFGYFFLGLHEKKVERFKCDAEIVKQYLGEPSFFKKGAYFSGGKLQTDRFAHSGKHSAVLDKENPYGFSYSWPYIRGNEKVRVSVWRYSNGKDSRNGILVASAKGMWKPGEEVVEKSDDGWEKIQFNFSPPPETKNQTLSIYCWNKGHDPIYFDDLEIEIVKEEPL